MLRIVVKTPGRKGSMKQTLPKNVSTVKSAAAFIQYKHFKCDSYMEGNLNREYCYFATACRVVAAQQDKTIHFATSSG
eukprot:11021820-Ditylum_brightwellii.AAC.1